jgi:tetratricopeptide (TPR) repeat protein
LKSEFNSFLGIFESLVDRYEEGLKLAEKAFLRSKEQKRIIQMFDSLYCKNVNLWYSQKRKEFIDESKSLEEIYTKIKSLYPDMLNEREIQIQLIRNSVDAAKIYFNDKYEWDLNKNLNRYKKSLEIAERMENKEWQMISYSGIANINDQLTNYDEAIESNQKALKLSEELGNKYFTSAFLEAIGWNYWGKGEYDLLLEYAKKALEIREKQGNERGVANSYAQIGVYYGMTGDVKECLELTQKAYNTLSENGKREQYKGWLHNIACCYYFMGEFDKALQTFQESYEFQKKMGFEYSSYNNLINIALIYYNQGELDKSLEIANECLSFYLRAEDKRLLAKILRDISRIYEKKGIFKKSLENLEKALEINLEIGNKDFIAGTYYDLILLTSKNKDLESARKYFTKLKDISEEIELKHINRLTLLAEGLILKNSAEFRDRIRAEVLFDQLLQEDLYFYLRMEILLQLSELLLFELKETSDSRYLAKLQENISKLIEIGTTNKIPRVNIECLWFKSQLALLDLDVEKARELLTQALNIAESKGLNSLALKITDSKEKLIKQSIELEELEEESPTISKRMDILKVENGFKELKNKDIFEFKVEKLESSDKLLSLKI